jgi:L-asparaginase II
MQYEVLTEVYRGKNINGRLVNPLLESVHLGMVAVVDEDGKERLSIGDTESEFYIRSAAKPFQAIPLLESGAVEHFHFTDQELALMSASHNAEPVHVQTAESILRKTGLAERHLGCGAHLPMHIPTAESMLSGHQPLNQLHNNCSGKI